MIIKWWPLPIGACLVTIGSGPEATSSLHSNPGGSERGAEVGEEFPLYHLM